MLSEWIYGNTKKNQTVRPLVLIVSAFAGGYTVMDYPQDFLNLFTTPIVQFLVFLSILYIAYYSVDDIKIYDLVLEALVGVLLIQFGKMMLRKIYKK